MSVLLCGGDVRKRSQTADADVGVCWTRNDAKAVAVAAVVVTENLFLARRRRRRRAAIHTTIHTTTITATARG